MTQRRRSALLLLACVVAISTTVSCLGKSAVKAEQVSPAGIYKAELIESDTGAVGGWVSIVRLSTLSPTWTEKLLRPGKQTVFGVDVQSQYVSMMWRTDTHLEIVCHKCDPNKVEVQKTAWGNVVVSYSLQ
jgi:hypothetical protein